MKRPVFSVVTPSLNQGNYIEENILSVRKQGYPHVEHIVVDGGSTDNTLEILYKYNKLKWVSEKDEGQAHALNKGFRMSRGDVICWINSDDRLANNALWVAAGFFGANPGEKAVTGAMDNMDAGGRHLCRFESGEYTFEYLLNENKDIRQSATFFKREVLDEVGDLREDLHYAMDYEFFLRMTRSFRIRNIPEPLSVFRRHGMSKSRSRDFEMLLEQKKVRRWFHGRRLSPAGMLLSRNLFKAYVKLLLGNRIVHAIKKLYGIS